MFIAQTNQNLTYVSNDNKYQFFVFIRNPKKHPNSIVTNIEDNQEFNWENEVDSLIRKFK